MGWWRLRTTTELHDQWGQYSDGRGETKKKLNSTARVGVAQKGDGSGLETRRAISVRTVAIIFLQDFKMRQ